MRITTAEIRTLFVGLWMSGLEGSTVLNSEVATPTSEPITLSIILGFILSLVTVTKPGDYQVSKQPCLDHNKLLIIFYAKACISGYPEAFKMLKVMRELTETTL